MKKGLKVARFDTSRWRPFDSAKRRIFSVIYYIMKRGTDL